MEKRKFDSEDRVVDFTGRTLDVVGKSPDARAGNYIAGQLIISGHFSTFNCSTVQGAESRNDFIHKMRVPLKELKKCRTALKIILRTKMTTLTSKPDSIYKEANELTAVAAKSIAQLLTTETRNKKIMASLAIQNRKLLFNYQRTEKFKNFDKS